MRRTVPGTQLLLIETFLRRSHQSKDLREVSEWARKLFKAEKKARIKDDFMAFQGGW